MTNDLKNMVAAMEERCPTAFHSANPRNTVPPAGYCNPRYYAASLVGNLLMVRDPEMNKLPHLTGYLTTLELVASRVPTYFIAYEFAEAVANTDLPADFKFAEIKWPLDAQLFVLPDQFIQHYYGCYAPFLAVCKFRRGMYPQVLGKRLPRTEISYPTLENQADKIAFDYPVFHDRSTPTDYNGNYPLSAGIECFQDAHWVDATAWEEERSGFKFPEREMDTNPEMENKFVNKALLLAVKLLMAISCRPGAVEHGHCARPAKVKYGRVVQKELWSPNVIGRAYRIPRQTAGNARLTANTRFTFRRGHYAWQAKQFKGVEFVSVHQMPRLTDGTIDFTAAGEDLSNKFRAVHERIWLEGILFGAEDDSSTAHATQP